MDPHRSVAQTRVYKWNQMDPYRSVAQTRVYKWNQMDPYRSVTLRVYKWSLRVHLIPFVNYQSYVFKKKR